MGIRKLPGQPSRWSTGNLTKSGGRAVRDWISYIGHWAAIYGLPVRWSPPPTSTRTLRPDIDYWSPTRGRSAVSSAPDPPGRSRFQQTIRFVKHSRLAKDPVKCWRVPGRAVFYLHDRSPLPVAAPTGRAGPVFADAIVVCGMSHHGRWILYSLNKS